LFNHLPAAAQPIGAFDNQKVLTRILGALVSNAFSQALVLLLNLVLVPVFFSHWSIRKYGEWLALSSVVAYLAALDSGMQMAAVNRLTQLYALGKFEDYRRIQHAAMVFYIFMAAIGTALLFAITFMLPVPRLLGIREIPIQEVRLCLIFLGLQVVWSIPLGLVTAIYRSTGRVATAQWIGNARQVISGFGTFVILLLGRGPREIALYQLLVLLAIAAGCLVDVNLRFPNLRLGVQGFTWKGLRELFAPSFMFFLIMVGNVISIQGPPVLISSLLGGVAVAEFVTCRSLISYGKQITSILTNSAWTDLTRMEAMEHTDRLHIFHRLFVGVTCAVSIGFNVLMAVEGFHIVKIWSGGKIIASTSLLVALSVFALLQTNWQTVSFVCVSSNRHSRVSLCTVLSSAVGIALMSVGLRHFGLVAVPLAMILSEGLVCYHFVIADACHSMNLSYPRFAFQLWSSTLLATALSGGVAGLLAWHFAAASVAEIFLIGICTESIAFAVMWLAFLRPPDRKFVMERITRSVRLRPAGQVG
jgi:O-antigen/teichoic acid export membrane protein